MPDPTDIFVHRHLGSGEEDLRRMLETVGFDSLDELSDAAVPRRIRLEAPLDLGPPRGESEALDELREIARRNRVFRSYIGMGYHDCVTPPVILRNLLENPGWYTQYTPYQAEIAQGRLEALLNFQTLVSDLTALPLATASLLDEGSAAAEAMAICHGVHRGKRRTFFADASCHPQTLAVLATRAEPLGIRLEIGEAADQDLGDPDLFGLLLQTPATDGRLIDISEIAAEARGHGVQVVVATDLLALTLVKPPGEMGADIAVGSSQRFGVPLGFGGPHAAFLTATESFQRRLPGRIVGISVDALGNPAYRLSLQTREQHIRREKATSNICTAQVLLAVIAGMYAVYHGPEGLRRIAERVHRGTGLLAAGLAELGHDFGNDAFFDTLRVRPAGISRGEILERARQREINLRDFGDGSLGIALDETVTRADLEDLFEVFATGEPAAPGEGSLPLRNQALSGDALAEIPPGLLRQGEILPHEIFHRYHSEHEMLRYLKRLENRDVSLTHSMIPLGSCTMKLNATAEMIPIGWPELARLHPFAPDEQTQGYRRLFADLEGWLAEITGLPAVSLQPNAGSQGELTGLLVIRAYHRSQGSSGGEDRDVCLIPTSAHGTNPASAVMAGLRVIAVECDDHGNIDLEDLAAKAGANRARLAALMITYPSTHGVFEEEIRRICEIVHSVGGQVYLDGANMNAQVGLCRPGDFGADVCHLNLHKTFCIPHGGGGPGIGPIAAAPHLAPFLPGHPVVSTGGGEAIGPVAAAPWGSAGILPITWMYIAMMGGEGLRLASQVAILNANYMARRLAELYPILYAGPTGLVAHEFILDMRELRKSAGITVDDIAKRLMDFGFHAPTMSWPVAGTMMVEPTESESKTELDRFCDALIAIREEIREVEEGRADREDNVLKNAPHPAAAVIRDDWDHPYGREQAAFPAPWVCERKIWPAVGRVDNAYGDRHLVCTCPPVESFVEDEETVPTAG